MKKLLIIALILFGLGVAPAKADVNAKKLMQARPIITHELVEQLTVECKNHGIFQPLPLKAFNRGELRLIQRYLHDNMEDRSLPQDNASGMDGARNKLDIAIREILGEITYSNIVNCFFVAITYSYRDSCDCVGRLPSGESFLFGVAITYTIFGLKFPPAPGTPLTLYYYREKYEPYYTTKVMPWQPSGNPGI